MKAGIVQKAWTYRYSSACFYASGQKDRLITPNFHYEEMGNSIEEQRNNYQKFLLIDEPYSDMVDAMLIKV